MEKILLAIDALHPDKPSLDFASFLARLTKSTLTGVFLENLRAEEKPVLSNSTGIPVLGWQLEESSDSYGKKMQVIEKNIIDFRESCTAREVNGEILQERSVEVKDLLAASRYADLLVVDASFSVQVDEKEMPSEYVRKILAASETPVVITPDHFDSVDEILFAYDGSASARFAIKQFTYLFPQWYYKKVTVLHVSEKGEWDKGDKNKVKEWLSAHYMNLHFASFKGNADTVLLDFMLRNKNLFIVLGAYGRNMISRLFRKSHAELLLKLVTHPVFIAHL